MSGSIQCEQCGGLVSIRHGKNECIYCESMYDDLGQKLEYKIFGYFSHKNNDKVAWLTSTFVPESLYFNKWQMKMFNPNNPKDLVIDTKDIEEFNRYRLTGTIMTVEVNHHHLNQIEFFFKFPSIDGYTKTNLFCIPYEKFGHINWNVERKWQGKYLYRLDIFDVFGTLVYQQEVMTNASDDISKFNLTRFLERLPQFLNSHWNNSKGNEPYVSYNYFI